MPEQAKIQTLHDYTTGTAIAPRTVLSAITAEGTEGQLVGFNGDNTLNVISPDEIPTEGSNKPITSGVIYNEINKLATKSELQDYIPVSEKEDLVTQEQLNTKAEKPVIITTTIPTETWAGEDTKTITVEVEGIKESDTPVVDVVLEGDSETKLALLSAWALIIDITTNEGSITVEAADIPEVVIPISMMVVR